MEEPNSGRTQVAEHREGPVRRRGRIGHKLVLSFVLLVMAVMGSSGWVLFALIQRSLERQMSEHLVATARLVSAGLHSDVLERLQPGYEDSRVYSMLTAQLQRKQEMMGARRIYAFDRRGRSLLDTQGDTPIGREYPHLRIRDRLELDHVWQGTPAHSVLFQDDEGTYYMTGYAPVFSGGEVVAGVGVDIGAGFVDTIRVFKRSVYIFASVGALLTVIVGLGLARTITRPIQRLVAAARDIGRGNLGRVVDTSARDELGYLGESMEEMRLKLLARDAQLRQMLAGVAHEIRNPLGGIELYAGLIAGDLPAEDGRKQHIQKVIGEVRKLDGVISEFLEFARPAPPCREFTSVSHLAEEAAFLLKPEMEKAGIEYRQEIAPHLQAFVDPAQIRRTLFNLMQNSVQAMRQGGELRVKAVQFRGDVAVEVMDTGVGMSPELRDRIFEPFHTTREKGSGLGMAIVRQTLEENRGRIEVESAVGRGTTCRVILPGSEDSSAERH